MYGQPTIGQTLQNNRASMESQSKPEPIACKGGCGLILEPKWHPGKVLRNWYRPVECENCAGKRAERERIEIEKKNLRRRRLGFTQFVKKLNIPPKFRYAKLGHIGKDLRALLTGSESLYLWGGIGVGKTYATIALARAEAIQYRTVHRIVFEDLLGKLRTFKDGVSEDMILKPYFESDLTILVDVGQANSEYVLRILFRIVDTRMEWNRKTLLTSNLSPESFYENCGGRLFSRIQEFNIVKLDGSDRRIKHRESR